ncbi:uncharacterized protein LOC106646196 [Copidosoma floridanum]|uniref:uncharacterized protein LOC106646196 n=1 Tax=Copidosoma floridanum TaxID=29053 RepID=UPI0006C98BE6|nr:uncharacterized protein LOC106646196 [Copidosoma floridanum]
MAKPSGSIKTLLENENIRKKVSCFIQEEVVLPQWSNDQNKHIYEKLFLEKQTFSLNKVSKPLDDEQQNNQNDPKNSYSNVCGFNVNIKTLLQNENIRKQVAPFIEKQIIIPVWSDGSDIEDSEINDITILPRNAKQLENQQPTQIKEEINVEDSTVISQGDVEKNQATDVMSFETNDGKSLCTNTDEKPNQEVNILPIKMEPQTSNVENQHPTIEQDLEYSNFASALKRIKLIKKRKKRFNALKNNPRKIGKLKIKRKKKRSIDNVRNHVCTSSYPPNEMKEIIEVTPMINLDDESSSTKNANVDENIQVTVIKEENTRPNSSNNAPPSALAAAVLLPWENSAADGGLSIMWAHLEGSRKMTESLALFRRNAEIALEDMRKDELLHDALRTEFHMRFLWGSRATLVNAAERHAKFVQVLDAMYERCAATEQI